MTGADMTTRRKARWLTLLAIAITAGLFFLAGAVRAPPSTTTEVSAHVAGPVRASAEDYVGDGGVPVAGASAFRSVRAPDMPPPGLPAWSEPLATMPAARPAAIEAAVAARRMYRRP
jgi:hypothetical protein